MTLETLGCCWGGSSSAVGRRPNTGKGVQLLFVAGGKGWKTGDTLLHLFWVGGVVSCPAETFTFQDFCLVEQHDVVMQYIICNILYESVLFIYYRIKKSKGFKKYLYSTQVWWNQRNYLSCFVSSKKTVFITDGRIWLDSGSVYRNDFFFTLNERWSIGVFNFSNRANDDHMERNNLHVLTFS